MKPFIITLACFIAFASQSCMQSELDVLVENLRIYCSEKVKNVDSTNKFDSLRIIRFDTITQKDILIKDASNALRTNDSLKIEFDYTASKLSASIRLARLSSGVSSSLFENYKSEV